MAIEKYSLNTTKELARFVVPARKISLIYFLTPYTIGFSIAGMISIFSGFKTADSPMILKFIFAPFLLFLFYLALTGTLALLWTIFGKEYIITERHFIRIDRILFFRFSSMYYDKKKILNIYVNSRDYEVNKISIGKNDFMSVFKIGTIHFNYDNKLKHIAGGFTDEDGRIFLEKLNSIK